MSVARSTTGTFDKQTSAIYQRDYVDRYLERMIADNRAAVEAKQADNIPAHVIAVWLNERADFEEKLLSELVQAELLVELVESSLREPIKKRFADDVVTAHMSSQELVLHLDTTFNFAARFRSNNGNENSTAESFDAAVHLFEICASVERVHPACVLECSKHFNNDIL
jgi:hypothetical protein